MCTAFRFMIPVALVVTFSAAPVSSKCCRGETPPGQLTDQLQKLDARVVPADSELADKLPHMLSLDVRGRRSAANLRELEAWRAVKTRDDWERFRDTRLAALQCSLGTLPPTPTELNVRVTGTVAGDGYRIDKLAFDSAPGVTVTANLYRPEPARDSMPGILICHSHHNPKTEGELQDMGMNWARSGCLVLVMDQIGHGERRQHPFVDSASYPHEFRVGRQDYYFRYNVGMQLHLAGQSLVGWIVRDLIRGVDVLCSQKGIDSQRIILLGSVAGGGDPAAVAAALDRRIAAAVPFNFGGPQPETTFPLPADAELSFNFIGGGSWESTRNLRLSARDGFLPWVIVGSLAPRRLIYGHEFAWDREHDPVWSRLEKLYAWYDVPDHLSSVHGRGSVRGTPPDATHCNNIGAVHRQQIYPAFERWFSIPAPNPEFRDRKDKEQLLVLAADKGREIRLTPAREVALHGPDAGLKTMRTAARVLAPDVLRGQLRDKLAPLVGDIEPKSAVKVVNQKTEPLGNASVQRVLLEVEPNIVVPLVLLIPKRADAAKVSVVIGIAQEGKQALLRARAETVADLLAAGVAVCLPDVRGTGESQPSDTSRGRNSSATSISSSELMLGQTLVGSRLRDLRSVLAYLRSRNDVHSDRLVIWGDSLAKVNSPDSQLAVPHDTDDQPDQSEPLGATLALLLGLYDDHISAVYADGGLIRFRSVLESAFCYLPHDVIVPGILNVADLSDFAAALAPRPVWIAGPVDGLNREVSAKQISDQFELAHAIYRSAQTSDRLRTTPDSPPGTDLAAWLAHVASRP